MASLLRFVLWGTFATEILVTAGSGCGRSALDDYYAIQPTNDGGQLPDAGPPDTSMVDQIVPIDANCPTGTFCFGACVDLTSNPQNCGGCDRLCPAGESCAGAPC